MIIYQIKTSKKTDPEAFAAFMRDEYIPAVHKTATRIGKVTNLKLLQGAMDTGALTPEFFLLVGWSGLSGGDIRIDNEETNSKFKTLGGRLKRLGSYEEIAAWKEK